MSFATALRHSLALLSCALLACAQAPARADDVRVLAAGAAKHALEALAPAFERASGHRLHASYDTAGALRDRLLQAAPGALADVVILSEPALRQLRAAQRVLPAADVPLGRVQVALAAPANGAAVDIGSPQQLRAALLSAAGVAYADPARGATAGTHFVQVLDALGIRDQLAGRITVLPFGGDVVDGVARGRFALGVSQSSEIMAHPGVRMVGALPPPYGQATAYAAALASDSDAARALLAFLSRPQAQEAFRSSGFSE